MAFFDHTNADPTYLNACASRIAESLNNLLQTGQASSNYVQCTKDSSGNGYTAGIINFSTSNGNAWQVVNKYMASDSYGGEFDTYANEIDMYAKDGSSSTNSLDGFCSAWGKAANNATHAFINSQNDILNTNYFSPAAKAANSLGIKLDVTKAAILDSAIMDGSSSLGRIMLDTNNSINSTIEGNSGNYVMLYGLYKIDEIEWLKLFLKQRQKENSSDMPNVASYNYIIENNPYNWDGIYIAALDSSGEKIVISC
ncbi:hypothetical protein EV178_002822 [Coemansia sp. RSA 1646]|nr:hypothetical protein EV178_002822 [Coemansia sp. RSA 1646]KAJ1771993.1 hypothetical protein LPJ74_001885 [Coemansia sp. RSA 1843]KAJ2089765.1 hypothetical protein IW138_003221 [Coemansia sp. RSA 986]